MCMFWVFKKATSFHCVILLCAREQCFSLREFEIAVQACFSIDKKRKKKDLNLKNTFFACSSHSQEEYKLIAS